MKLSEALKRPAKMMEILVSSEIGIFRAKHDGRSGRCTRICLTFSVATQVKKLTIGEFVKVPQPC